MKQIQPTANTYSWPRSKADNVECRERDLVIRITDWMSDEDEPGFDVEVYIGGVYDWNESGSFTIWKYKSKEVAKNKAIKFANRQIAKLL